MKKKYWKFLLLFSTLAVAQNYSLDTSFGDSGKMVVNSPFATQQMLLVNGNYFLASNDFTNGQLAKVLYSGTPDLSFGTNGFLSMNTPNVARLILGLKYLNGWFYVFGSTNQYTNLPKDGFVAKISESGIFDPNFGNGGIATIDFGTSESIYDLVLDQSGKLYCSGTKILSTETTSESKIFYSKITAQGAIDLSFDASGFKSLPLSYQNWGGFIKPYNGYYLLVGVKADPAPQQQQLLVAALNENGSLNTSFGASGYREADIVNGFSCSVIDCFIENQELYVDYYAAYSFTSKGSGLLNVNLASGASVFNNFNMGFAKQQSLAYNGKIYVTGASYCGGTTTTCNQDFKLWRYFSNGTLDTSFQNGGSYTYTFPTSYFLGTESLSSSLIVQSDGKIVVGGITHNVGSSPFALGMIRIGESTLTTPEETAVQKAVYPNPVADFVHIPTQSGIDAISISDALGRTKKLLFTADGPDFVQADLSGISSGFLILTVTYSNGTTVNTNLLKK